MIIEIDYDLGFILTTAGVILFIILIPVIFFAAWVYKDV